MNQTTLTPLQMELSKLLNVLKGDKMVLTHEHLSITPINERPEWFDTITKLEQYIKDYEQNIRLIEAYKQHKAKKQKQQQQREREPFE